jgi:hypothetical protein
MARPQSQRLRSLQESARPLGELFQIHIALARPRPISSARVLGCSRKAQKLTPGNDMGMPNF